MKKIEFSKKWLIGCIIFSAGVTVTSYVLAGFDKNPVSELSVAVIDACWGASGVSFIGYALQNSVRAFTASKFGIPKRDVKDTEKPKAREIPPELDEVLKKLYEGSGNNE